MENRNEEGRYINRGWRTNRAGTIERESRAHRNEIASEKGAKERIEAKGKMDSSVFRFTWNTMVFVWSTIDSPKGTDPVFRARLSIV